MACCGGGTRQQRIRTQSVDTPAKQAAVPIQRKIGKNAAQPVNVQRQHVLPRQQCTKCGYPGMAVTVAGRERMQCSNVNCRLLLD